MSGRCCHGLRNWMYNIAHTPISRKNFLIGVLGIITILIVIIILAATLSPGSGSKGTNRGSQILKITPLVIGSNDLLWKIKKTFKDKISSIHLVNLTSDCKDCQTDLNILKNAMVGSQIWSLKTDCSKSQFKDGVSLLLDQMDLAWSLSVRSNSMEMALSISELNHLFDAHKLSCFLSIRGGHSIDGRFTVLRNFYRLGARMMSLSEKQDCTPPWIDEKTGLNDFGKDVIWEMNRLGMVIDLSGSPLNAVKDVLNISHSPVVFSHANSYALCDKSMDNLNDEVLKTLKSKNSLVMVSFSKNQLCGNGSMDDLIAHLNDLKNKLGSDKVGIGGHYDSEDSEMGTDLKNQSTAYKNLFDLLKNPKNSTSKGWSEKELKGLAGDNWERILKGVEETAIKLHSNGTEPRDNYEPKTDYKDINCYSDFDIRYDDEKKSTVLTTLSTTKPTENPTGKTTEKPKKT